MKINRKGKKNRKRGKRKGKNGLMYIGLFLKKKKKKENCCRSIKAADLRRLQKKSGTAPEAAKIQKKDRGS